jgi:hypothetical protein
MATIPASEARNIFTSKVIAVFKERPQVFSFLRSFFPTEESFDRYISIDVQRGLEKVAVDVIRGSEGNFNKFSLANQKKFDPPYYREWFDVTETDLYNRMLGTGDVDSFVFAAFIENVVSRIEVMRNIIERAYELQCAQVLDSGIVALKSGDNIDFKRQSGSKVDESSTPWTTGTNNPITTLQLGCDWLRAEGKSQGSIVNAIFGAKAWNALLDNTLFKSRSDIKSFDLASIATGPGSGNGGRPLGRITVGGYEVNCWGYNEGYETASNTFTKYIPEEKVIMLPENPGFKLAFAGVPTVFDINEAPVTTGAYHLVEELNKYQGVHKMGLKSAGLAIPVAVDKIYTVKVTA